MKIKRIHSELEDNDDSQNDDNFTLNMEWNEFDGNLQNNGKRN